MSFYSSSVFRSDRKIRKNRQNTKNNDLDSWSQFQRRLYEIMAGKSDTQCTRTCEKTKPFWELVLKSGVLPGCCDVTKPFLWPYIQYFLAQMTLKIVKWIPCTIPDPNFTKWLSIIPNRPKNCFPEGFCYITNLIKTTNLAWFCLGWLRFRESSCIPGVGFSKLCLCWSMKQLSYVHGTKWVIGCISGLHCISGLNLINHIAYKLLDIVSPPF